MFYLSFRRFAVVLLPALALTACSTVDFSQPEIPLAEPFSKGATVRLGRFGGSASPGSLVEGPSLDILQDQLAYGVVRCSRPGPDLDLEIAADFTDRGGPGRDAQRLLGVATWRDPATRRIVGRHHIDVGVEANLRDRLHVNVSADDDGLGSDVTRGQVEAGEAFVAQVCERAFGAVPARG